MKKVLLLSAVALCTALAASAQISKGSSYLGGNVGFSTFTTKPDNAEKRKSTGFNLSPSIGFAYKENHVWGLSLSYGHRKYTEGSAKETFNGFGIGAFLRQYKPLGKGCYLFAQESLNGYYNITKINSNPEIEDKTYSGNLSLSPGFAYDISKKFQLELVLSGILYAGYNERKIEASTNSPIIVPTQKSNTLNVGSNLSNLAEVGAITIGARFAFGR